MTTYTLDKIVRSVLADRQYPMHFYIQFLGYGVDCLRELAFDVIPNIKSRRFPVTSYGAIVLPCDFVDYIRIGAENGQYVEPFVEKTDFNRLNKFNDSGQKIKYDEAEWINWRLPSGWSSFWFAEHVNQNGEILGKLFGNKASFRYSFQVIRERNEIQLDRLIADETVTMDYITDGTSTTALSAVHPYAWMTIKKYIVWRYKEDSRRYNNEDRERAKQEYYNELRILRGRNSDLDVHGIKVSLAQTYSASIK